MRNSNETNWTTNRGNYAFASQAAMEQPPCVHHVFVAFNSIFNEIPKYTMPYRQTHITHGPRTKWTAHALIVLLYNYCYWNSLFSNCVVNAVCLYMTVACRPTYNEMQWWTREWPCNVTQASGNGVVNLLITWRGNKHHCIRTEQINVMRSWFDCLSLSSSHCVCVCAFPFGRLWLNQWNHSIYAEPSRIFPLEFYQNENVNGANNFDTNKCSIESNEERSDLIWLIDVNSFQQKSNVHDDDGAHSIIMLLLLLHTCNAHQHRTPSYGIITAQTNSMREGKAMGLLFTVTWFIFYIDWSTTEKQSERTRGKHNLYRIWFFINCLARHTTLSRIMQFPFKSINALRFLWHFPASHGKNQKKLIATRRQRKKESKKIIIRLDMNIEHWKAT